MALEALRTGCGTDGPSAVPSTFFSGCRCLTGGLAAVGAAVASFLICCCSSTEGVGRCVAFNDGSWDTAALSRGA